ncbi:MAG: Ger(x)C family spore germination protein [Firmicutes bacterium]|nr:Ger(x)C family spore germination protein [Bacillota bacterium]
MLSKITCRLIALLLLTSFCLVGCWDSEEITSLAPVVAIGIDAGSEPNLMRISAQMALPAAGGGGGAGSGAAHTRLRVLTVEAKSLTQAFALLQSRTRRRHFFLHLNHVVFGAQLARHGLGRATEALQAWPQIRGSTLAFVSEETAEQVLHAHSGIGQDPGSDISHIIRSVSSAPVARKMTLNDMINALSSPGSTTLTLPILGLRPLALTSGDENPAAGVGIDGEQYMEVQLKGTALFERDRWVAELSVRETQTLAVLVGAAKRGMSTMVNPENPEGKLAPQYERIRVSYRVNETAPGQLQVVTRLRVDIRLVEIHGGYDPQLSDTAPIEATVKQDITNRVSALFQKLQAHGLDSVNIGQRIKQQKPKLWRQLEADWLQIYPSVEFVVEAVPKVRNLGLIKNFYRLGE